MKRTRTDISGYRRLFRSSWLMYLLTLAAATAAAQSSRVSYPDTLSLDTCLSIAVANSPELRMATHDVDASILDRQLVDRSRWPDVRLVGGAGYAPVSHDFGYDPAVSNGGELGARIVLEQNIYSGGTRGTRVRQADNQIDLSAVVKRQQERDLVFAVRQSFIELLAARQIRDLRRQSVERLSEYSELTASLNQSGAVGYADLLNATVNLDRARVELTTADEAVTTARLNLCRLLGVPGDTAFTVTGSLEHLLTDASDTTAPVPPVSAEENLDLGAARLNLSQSQLALSLSKAQWKPTVSIVADAGVLTSRENLLLPDAERYRSAGYSVGLSVEMPLWDWGRRKREVSRSRLQVRSAEDNIALIRRDLQAAYRTSSLRLQSARRRLASTRAVAQTAEKNYVLNKAQYAGGSASASDVLLAQQAVTDTQQSVIETLAEIQLLQAHLFQLTQSDRETAQ